MISIAVVIKSRLPISTLARLFALESNSQHSIIDVFSDKKRNKQKNQERSEWNIIDTTRCHIDLTPII